MPAKKKDNPKAGKAVFKKTASPQRSVSSLRFRYSKPDFSSFRLQLNGMPLPKRLHKQFFKRLTELEEADVHLIYRGDKKDRILNKFNLPTHTFSATFNNSLFMIGEKGRYFWENANRNDRQTIPTFSLTDTSNEFLESIFDMLRSIIIKKDYQTPLQLRLQKFEQEHPVFMRFFKYKKNRKEFVTKIQNAKPSDRLRARDYYLSLLHQFGKNDFYPVSFLLSATERFSVAKSFIRWEQIADNGIILFAWVPRSIDYVIYTNPRFAPRLIFEVIGLPTATKMFYKEQYEITLKGGLLPSYIIGYFYKENGTEYFEINPAMFNISNPDWPQEGLPIDQRRFNKLINNTQFHRAFFVTQQGDYHEF